MFAKPKKNEYFDTELRVFLSLTFSKVLETWFNRTSHCLSFDAAPSTPPAGEMSRVPGFYHSPAMSPPDRNKNLKELDPESKKPAYHSAQIMSAFVELWSPRDKRIQEIRSSTRKLRRLAFPLLQTRSSRGRKVRSVLCPAIVSPNPSSYDAKLCARVPECSSLCACGLATRTGLSYKGPHTHMDNSSLLFLPKVCKSPNFRNS